MSYEFHRWEEDRDKDRAFNVAGGLLALWALSGNRHKNTSSSAPRELTQKEIEDRRLAAEAEAARRRVVGWTYNLLTLPSILSVIVWIELVVLCCTRLLAWVGWFFIGDTLNGFFGDARHHWAQPSYAAPWHAYLVVVAISVIAYLYNGFVTKQFLRKKLHWVFDLIKMPLFLLPVLPLVYDVWLIWNIW